MKILRFGWIVGFSVTFWNATVDEDRRLQFYRVQRVKARLASIFVRALIKSRVKGPE